MNTCGGGMDNRQNAHYCAGAGQNRACPCTVQDPVGILFEQIINKTCNCKRANCSYTEEFDAFAQHFEAIADLLKNITRVHGENTAGVSSGQEALLQYAESSGLVARVTDGFRQVALVTFRA